MNSETRFRVRWGRDDWGRKDRKTKKHLLGYFTEAEIRKLNSMLNIANWYMDVKLYYVGRSERSWLKKQHSRIGAKSK